MKIITVFIFLTFVTFSKAQTKISHTHCQCEDEFEQTEPAFNGTYKRTCKGVIMEQGLFVNGSKDGNWKSWSKSGKLIKDINYLNGVLNGKFELYFISGKKKFIGAFNNGQKEGIWTFYNKNEKIIKTGLYERGIPKGIWKVFDFKGKKEVIVYNYDNNSYIKNEENTVYFEKEAIIQNDNSEEWYIRHRYENPEKSNIRPIEGYVLSNDFYTNLIEIPYDIWDTYMQNDFTTTVTFKNNEISQIQIDSTDAIGENYPIYTFLISTNTKDKLTEVDHSKIARKLLETKILENLWLMGPWIGTAETQKIRTVYVINKFFNSPYH